MSLILFKKKHYNTYATDSASDFLHKVISIYYSRKSSTHIVPEVEVVFISDPKDITQKLYLGQLKSMFCRKLVRRFHETKSQDLEYTCLPNSFKICQLFLFSNYLILLIFIFNSISKSDIVVAIIIINSLRMTF